jgi:CelD/BcsL family acetyltransferase involved in cellulose biosynthesis
VSQLACQLSPPTSADRPAARLPAFSSALQHTLFNAPDLDWAGLASAWRKLQASSARLPTQDLEWCFCAAHTLHHPSHYRIATLQDSRQLIAAAPLALCDNGPWQHLELLSQRLLHEPMDLLYQDPAALYALVQQCLSWGYPLLLRRVEAGSLLTKLLQDQHLPAVLSRVAPSAPSPVLHLSPRWQEPEACVGARARRNYRRALRRAEQYGPVNAHIITPSPSELDHLLDLAFTIEASGWKAWTRTALRDDPLRASFLRHYAEQLALQKQLRIALLYLDSQAVAMQIAAQTHQAWWLLRIGYNEQFAACSPGQLLMHATIACAAQAGLERFEFLGSVEPWNHVWTHDQRNCVSIELFPGTLHSARTLVGRAASVIRRRISSH